VHNLFQIPLKEREKKNWSAIEGRREREKEKEKKEWCTNSSARREGDTASSIKGERGKKGEFRRSNFFILQTGKKRRLSLPERIVEKKGSHLSPTSYSE